MGLALTAWKEQTVFYFRGHNGPAPAGIGLIGLIIVIKYKIVFFSFGTTFGGSIQTLQCARAQANMLRIQCFSLEFCLQCPAWADFEEWQLVSPLTYMDAHYLT